jgi:hypothetical protein
VFQHEILAQSIRVDVIAPIERLLDDYTEVHAVVSVALTENCV